MDSGGSTGRLRDQLGVLPPGDLRQVLVALSSSPQIWRDLFTYRFEGGDLNGRSFGNIFLSALEKITGSIEDSIELAATLLQTQGTVIPITLNNVHLSVKLANGRVIKGEAFIDKDERDRPKIVESFLTPKALANPKALKAIKESDFIILGPGDVYTSLVPNLLVEGVAVAINKSKAKKVYIVNLMTKVGQTTNFTALDHLHEVQKYLLGAKIDFVIVNNTAPPKKLLNWYKKFGAAVVHDDLGNGKKHGFKAFRADIVSDTGFAKATGDKLSRSLIRHNSDKLVAVLMRVLTLDRTGL